MRTLFILIIISIGLIGCDETKKIIDTAGLVQLSGKYEVVSLTEASVENNAPTLIFDPLEKRINGTTSCNRYFGSYNLDLYALSFSEIASTEMACPPPIMDVEMAFLNALGETGSYLLEGDVLTLYSKNNRSVLLKASKIKSIEETEE